jgi:hypothetical protein
LFLLYEMSGRAFQNFREGLFVVIEPMSSAVPVPATWVLRLNGRVMGLGRLVTRSPYM